MHKPAIPESVRSEYLRLFEGSPLFYRAPGRINIIGEHTDYNQGWVLPAALDLYSYAAIAPRGDRILRVHACNYGETEHVDLDRIERGEGGNWLEYVKGVAWSLARDGVRLRGADIVLSGEIPLGSGLSSSASVEVLLARALLGCAGLPMGVKELARACQQAESEFVGVQCGIMDQYVIACSSYQQAMKLDCRSLIHENVQLPQDAVFLLVHSGVKRRLTQGSYNSRRDECEEAVKQLSSALPGLQSLRDLKVEQLASHKDRLSDLLYRRCRHVVSENTRVHKVYKALKNCDSQRVGQHLTQSHISLRDDFEVSCKELDDLVNISLDCDGVLGSRMMGAGFGGCTISLVESEKLDTVMNTIGKRYGRISGGDPWMHAVGPAMAAGSVEPGVSKTVPVSVN